MILAFLLLATTIFTCLCIGRLRHLERMRFLVAPIALATLAVIAFLMMQAVLQALVALLLIGMAVGAVQASSLADRLDRHLPILRMDSFARHSLLFGLAVAKRGRRGKAATATLAVLRLGAVLIAVVCVGALLARVIASVAGLLIAIRRPLRRPGSQPLPRLAGERCGFPRPRAPLAAC